MLSSNDLRNDLTHLNEVFLLEADNIRKFRTYRDLIQDGNRISIDDVFVRIRSAAASDVCNLQYTSGTTGSPKAAMLTHRYCHAIDCIIYCN